ncbi:MAG: conditioned medium factor, partial [Planctomycetota bacterium]
RRAGAARRVTARMLTGNPAATIGSLVPPPNLAAHRGLMLVHGYCSGGSIWPAADFTAPKLEFLDPSANRTHDQFAQLIAQRAAAAQLTSFGIVAHSQGGPAALQLLTYYTSGLDFATNGRRIQSLASPYQGTPLASLGAFACGVNNDMTPAGAATWLAGIPTWARAEVFTWTTSDAGTPCNAFTNLFLANPEDGTVEKTRAELPSGNNMGHVTGWCHTTGMTSPASYTDQVRNLLMDAAAAR